MRRLQRGDRRQRQMCVSDSCPAVNSCAWVHPTARNLCTRVMQQSAPGSSGCAPLQRCGRVTSLSRHSGWSRHWPCIGSKAFELAWRPRWMSWVRCSRPPAINRAPAMPGSARWALVWPFAVRHPLGVSPPACRHTAPRINAHGQHSCSYAEPCPIPARFAGTKPPRNCNAFKQRDTLALIHI